MYINNEVSETDPVDLSVVPQGSILSSLLFNVYIDILSTAVEKSELIFYVDETVFVVAASTSQELNHALRYDFNLIFNWCFGNKLTLNVEKTELTLSGSKTMLLQFNNFPFFY